MSDTLQRICATTAKQVAERQRQRPEAELRLAAIRQPAPRGFRAALEAKRAAGGIGLIAEVKKASPSKGLIRAHFDPAALAAAYERAGAACVSVLTDQAYFQGDDAHFEAARAAISLPMIRKDFMIDPYQIVESRALGADCILLIVAALSPAQAREIEDEALALGMDVLIEVHDEAERDFALSHLRSPLLGINNRNLKTLEVSLSTTGRLLPAIPPGYTVVSESGVADAKDVATLRALGVDCFLVGESLMRQTDVEAAARQLIGG